MRFSRKALVTDFEIELDDWNKKLPERVVNLVNLGQVREAIVELRGHMGWGLLDCKNVIGQYQAFRKAMNDFGKGEDVFVEYI